MGRNRARLGGKRRAVWREEVPFPALGTLDYGPRDVTAIRVGPRVKNGPEVKEY